MNPLKPLALLLLMGQVANAAVLVDADGFIVGYTQEPCGNNGLPCHGFGYGGQIVGTGPQGIQGREGVAGEPGEIGPKGDKGDQGPQGEAAPARAPAFFEAKPTTPPNVYNIGAEVRWADFKHFSLNSGYRYDTKNHGNTIDAAIVQIKVGSSYEQRRLDRLEADIRAMQHKNIATIEMDGFEIGSTK